MKSWEDFSLEAHKNGYSKELAREFIYTAYEYRWSNGYNVIKQVISWKNVNYKELVNEIKDMFEEKGTNSAKEFMKGALKAIPLGLKDTIEANKQMKDKAQKLLNKPLKLKEVTEKNPLKYIYNRFAESEINLDKAIKEIEILEKKYGNYNKIYDNFSSTGDNLAALVYLMGMSSVRWPDKDPKFVEKLIPLLKKYDKWGFYLKRAAEHWGKGTANKVMMTISNKVKEGSSKLENKPLKLKEEVSITEKQEIDKLHGPFNFISYGEKHGYSYYLFQKFTRYYPDYVFRAGRDWANFDFQKGYDLIIKRKDALNLFRAGRDWNWGKFPKQEALEFLKMWDKQKDTGYMSYYEQALDKWPKNIKETEKAIEDIKAKSTKFPNKSLRLKESVLDDRPYVYGDKKELTLKEIIEDLFLNHPTIAWSNVGYMFSQPEKFSKDDREVLYNFLQKFPVPVKDKGYSKSYRFYDDLMKGLKPIKHAEQTIDKIKKASTKMPNKPLKLKEDVEDFETIKDKIRAYTIQFTGIPVSWIKGILEDNVKHLTKEQKNELIEVIDKVRHNILPSDYDWYMDKLELSADYHQKQIDKIKKGSKKLLPNKPLKL
jgi:hypothetical protein